MARFARARAEASRARMCSRLARARDEARHAPPVVGCHRAPSVTSMHAVAPSASWYASALAAATPCGSRVVYGSDRTLVVVRARTGEVEALVRAPARIHAVCCVDDDDADDAGDDNVGIVGREYAVVCAMADKTLRVFNIASMSFDAARTLRGGHAHEVTSCCAFGAGGVASACRNGAVALWSVRARGSSTPVATHKVMDGAITVIAASVGASGIIAVGGANGTVCALDVARGTSRRRAASGFGEITALSWTVARDGSGSERELLAVGTRERKVTIWALEDDGSLTTTHALHLPKPSAPLSEAQRGRVWVAVAWIPTPMDNDECEKRADASGGGDYRAPRLITSGQGGDLLSWRVPMKTDTGNVVDVKDAQTFGPRDAAHTRTIFTITVIPPSQSAATTCVSTSLDRKVACWDVDALERRWSFDALGGFVYSISIDACDPLSVIYACGDGTVHAWDCSPTLTSGVRGCLLWKGLPNTKVTSVAKHPGGDVVAFGLEDGRVGCFDTASGKFALYPECHGGAVHSLAWLEIRSSDDDVEEEALMTLTSASADGDVWRWLDTFNPATNADVKKSGVLDARKYGKYVDLGTLYGGSGGVDDGDDSLAVDAFEYSPRRGWLALGWSSGELSAHDFGEERWRCLEHVKGITCVRWHPESDDDSSKYASWLASASKSGSTLVHGARGVVACALPKHAVLDMSWSPRRGCAILACAQHGCVKVWSFEGAIGAYRATALANFSGHVGKVLSVKFAAHDDEIVVSGGDDKTLRVWNYTDAEHGVDDPTLAAMTPTIAMEGSDDASGRENEHSAKTSNAAKSSSKKSSSGKSKKSKGSSMSTLTGAFFKPSACENTPEVIAEGQRAAVALAKLMYKSQGEALEQDALTSGPRGIAAYADTDAVMNMLANEATMSASVDESDIAARARGLEKAAALHVYRGDYAGAASMILGAGDAPISSELMSLFIGGGHEVWSVVANAQCERLIDAGEHQRAALLRLSLHDVAGAVRTLRLGGLLRDAATLASARLLPTDALLLDIRRELAAAEEARGSMEAAAKAHLAVGAPAAAVRALTRLDRGGARAAAEVIVACGLTGALERRTVIRAVVELAEMDDFAAALGTFDSAEDALDVADGYVRDIVRLERAFALANIDEFHDVLTSMSNDAVVALTRAELWLEYSLSRRQRRHRRLALARAIFRDIARAYEFDVAADPASTTRDLAVVPVDAHDAHDVHIATMTSNLLSTDGVDAASLVRALLKDTDDDTSAGIE